MDRIGVDCDEPRLVATTSSVPRRPFAVRRCFFFFFYSISDGDVFSSLNVDTKGAVAILSSLESDERRITALASHRRSASTQSPAIFALPDLGFIRGFSLNLYSTTRLGFKIFSEPSVWISPEATVLPLLGIVAEATGFPPLPSWPTATTVALEASCRSLSVEGSGGLATVEALLCSFLPPFSLASTRLPPSDTSHSNACSSSRSPSANSGSTLVSCCALIAATGTSSSHHSSSSPFPSNYANYGNNFCELSLISFLQFVFSTTRHDSDGVPATTALIPLEEPRF
ncbi:unnamed protein product [Linum trigynum]|uniref:Uncharacterized protein n=1 Tax=Linum trigynum TaxID=586398 RepID=A0AAV2E5G3_9ROSI